jgi:DNA-binding transcriptional LysR family regulator
VTLPLKHPDLRIEEIRRDRLVVCLRRDDALADKAALQTTDLQENLAVLYHPQRHPDAHERLLELLADAGVKIEEYSRASHPFEMHMLVKEGHGFTLIREGSVLDEELTTRPIDGVDWTAHTAVIFHKLLHPKTVPILVRKFGKQFHHKPQETRSHKVSVLVATSMSAPKRPAQPAKDGPVQLTFFREVHERQRNGTR